ncbi:hypothetical protein GCM10022211_09020 [Sphingomonas humi]|uniref:Uncharacterized protein n=2 Tax=Sphingomonas humi TaxID=335630 RepID=A0ABP7RQC4_9SPHN
MTGRTLLQALAGGSLAALLSAAPAAAQNRTYLDVSGALGYSTNPDLSLVGRSSAYGRVSANGYHSWGGERSNTSLSAYVENSYYFRRLSNRQLFSLNAFNTTRVSETTRLYGGLSFSGDFGAQLSSRFFVAPTDPNPTDGTDPVIPPSVVVLVSPDLVALSQRQYRVSGSGGGEFRLSPVDTLVASVGAQHVFYGGNNQALLDSTQYDGALGYQRQLSERLSLGGRLIGTRTDYSLGRGITSYGAQLTVSAQLAELLSLTAAAGLTRTEQDFGNLGGKTSGTDLALDASLCRTLEFERFCLRAARRAQGVAFGVAPTSTSASLDYSRRLGAKDQVQASFAYVTTDAASRLFTTKQSFYSASGSYDRSITDRLSAGVSASVRKLSIAGNDPKTDVGGSLFIRNRFGSVR